MRGCALMMIALAAACLAGLGASAQEYGTTDDGQPGDAMIQAHLARLADRLHATFLDGVESDDDWDRLRPRFKDEYLFMLGLSPMPEKTPLQATVTGTVDGLGYHIAKLHYQSVPGLYVTASLYRPSDNREGDRLPAVLYVCGHTDMGRDGNKAAYQSHGIWLARHGYVCLVVDTLQLGEIAGVHHGTYREGRWWWHSRGYTPAGVECWNGVRGIDYLVSRPDVDPDRIAVTGISGGGAATYWIAAADDRVKVAVPVSGMADLPAYVNHRVINGHCDCMFLDNTFEWPWLRIAGLIAPRPLLYVNSDQDAIFPMDANQRNINRLERLYSRFGAGDRVDAVVSIGGHAYRRDIREAAYRFLNTYLKNDPRPITDSETDVASELGRQPHYPIDPERLRVFPTDADIPDDQKNTTIDRTFVPLAKVELPEEEEFEPWKDRLLSDLRRLTFHAFPDRIDPARPLPRPGDAARTWVETEPGIAVPLLQVAGPEAEGEAKQIILIITASDSAALGAEPFRGQFEDGDAAFVLQPRGIGPTAWTRKNPPNYVERAHVLLGRTVDSERVRDIAASARYLRSKSGEDVPVIVAGTGASGVLGAYAALVEPDITGVVLIDPPASHMDEDAPPLLNVLRVLDIPEALGLLAPRPLTIQGGEDALRDRAAAIYEQAGASDQINIR